MTKLRAPRVAFVNVPSAPLEKDAGVLTRDGLAFFNSIEDRLSNVEALAQILLRPLNSEALPNSRNIFKDFGGASPALTASAAKVMMGLGATWVLTPRSSGVVEIMFRGYTTNSLTGNAKLNAAYGTGAAPANGAALTGTLFDTLDDLMTSANAGLGPANEFCFISEASGLTLGTKYWFDPALGSSAGNSALTVTGVRIQEVPL